MSKRDVEAETTIFLLVALRALQDGQATVSDIRVCLNLAGRWCPRVAQRFREQAYDSLYAAREIG